MDKTIFANRLAAKIRTTEHAIDKAIAAAADLTSEMTTGRIQAGFAAQSGHRGLLDTLAAVGSLGQARSQVIASHDRLAMDARKFGIDITMIGPLEHKPDEGITAPPAALAPLRAVG